ncbi:hypothetical protein EDD57_1351 [Baia soyae]|uniref:Uncharacterized protein n=1 Tax=Baia soyae TaxID=1544746 RepID=A0A4R2RPV4_9BACL|nr:hypothetical protein EDD57_1351 [Baia soyae]
MVQIERSVHEEGYIDVNETATLMRKSLEGTQTSGKE